MKVAVLVVAVCASLGLTHARPEQRGIGDVVEKVKEFYEYLKSGEFQNKLKSVISRLQHAPCVAVECFKNAAEGNKEDIDAIAQKIRERLEEDFVGDQEENEHGFQKLRRILAGCIKALADAELRKDIIDVAGEYKEAAQQAVECFKAELEGIKADAQKLINDIKEKFFGSR